MSGIEALYIYDEHKYVLRDYSLCHAEGEPRLRKTCSAGANQTDNETLTSASNLLLSHSYQSRPPSPASCISAYLSYPQPRPSCVYLSSTSPPSTLFSLIADSLLFLSPTSGDVPPLLVLEFLHRISDCLSGLLGSPLLASRLEANYDIAAQVLSEACDAGMVASTEPDAVRENIDTPSAVARFFGLPGSSAPSAAAAAAAAQHRTSMPGLGSGGATASMMRQHDLQQQQQQGGAIPWRRSNVRHTSNELYVDLIETLDVTFAPSGRAISAFANGTIAFTSKVSGVPDLLLNLTTGSMSGVGGGDRAARLSRVMKQPVFHPCVRLARWKQHGELSFVPPDGRFVLMGYETDLLNGILASSSHDASSETLIAGADALNLPVSLSVTTGLGAAGNEVEVKLSVNPRFSTPSSSSSSAAGPSLNGSRPHSPRPTSAGPRIGPRGPVAATLASITSSTDGAAAGSPPQPIENLVVKVPLAPAVRKVPDVRASRGEAHFSPADAAVLWSVPAKVLAQVAGASLRFSFAGQQLHGGGGGEEMQGVGGGVADRTANGFRATTYDYDEGDAGYQNKAVSDRDEQTLVGEGPGAVEDEERRRVAAAAVAALMPSSVNVSFSVKGWLASGLKVDSLALDPRKSKGLGEGVRPYKGVKYLTVSRDGIEVRC